LVDILAVFTFAFMETKEIFDIITSSPKWYAGMLAKNGKFHNPQSANRIKARFSNGTLPEKTIEEIFNHFGYFKNKVTWEKK